MSQRWHVLTYASTGAAAGRSARQQRLIDLALAGCAAGFGALILVSSVDGRSTAGLATDVLIGAVACAALYLRRTAVLPVAILGVAASAVAASAAGAALVALFTAAIRLPRRAVAVLTVAAVLATGIFPLIVPDAGGYSYSTQLLLGSLINLGVVGWGLMVGAQRNYLRTVLQHTKDLELRQHLLAANARDQERRRIAREMHDVLAHRLSLLSVQAGALEFRSDLSPDKTRQIAGVIRQTTHQALNELQEVIGILRDGTDGATLLTPAVGLDDLAPLIDEVRLGGSDIRFEPPGDGVRTGLPENLAVEATAYRIVQEGLTNARKHAPDSPVRVLVRARAAELVVTVSTFLRGEPAAVPAAIPGGGTGLRGLGERASLVGGDFSVETVGNQFVIIGRLPWTL
ncbi:sensor histidine kinase [Kribbella hippodromi]